MSRSIARGHKRDTLSETKKNKIIRLKTKNERKKEKGYFVTIIMCNVKYCFILQIEEKKN